MNTKIKKIIEKEFGALNDAQKNIRNNIRMQNIATKTGSGKTLASLLACTDKNKILYIVNSQPLCFEKAYVLGNLGLKINTNTITEQNISDTTYQKILGFQKSTKNSAEIVIRTIDALGSVGAFDEYNDYNIIFDEFDSYPVRGRILMDAFLQMKTGEGNIIKTSATQAGAKSPYNFQKIDKEIVDTWNENEGWDLVSVYLCENTNKAIFFPNTCLYPNKDEDNRFLGFFETYKHFDQVADTWLDDDYVDLQNQFANVADCEQKIRSTIDLINGNFTHKMIQNHFGVGLDYSCTHMRIDSDEFGLYRTKELIQRLGRVGRRYSEKHGAILEIAYSRGFYASTIQEAIDNINNYVEESMESHSYEDVENCIDFILSGQFYRCRPRQVEGITSDGGHISVTLDGWLLNLPEKIRKIDLVGKSKHESVRSLKSYAYNLLWNIYNELFPSEEEEEEEDS